MFGSTVDQWFAIQVRPQSERMVSLLLRYKGYEDFLPLHPSGSTRGQQRLRPLFPGYLFCRVTPNAQGLIVTTPGVVRILGVGSQPLPVPADEVESLRKIVTSGFAIETWQALEEGEIVELTQGALRGCRGIVKTVKSHHRLIVSITLLHRSVSVELSSDSVRRVARLDPNRPGLKSAIEEKSETPETAYKRRCPAA